MKHRLVSRSANAGFSLVELMVAMALSLLLLAGVLAIFASSRTTYETTDRLSRIQENGRFALETIVRDLRAAGFTGCSQRAPFTSLLRHSDQVLWDFEFPIQGFEGDGTSWSPALDTGVATEANAIGDAIAIRMPVDGIPPVRLTDFMSSTSAPVETADVGAELINANDIVQISDCRNRVVFQVTGNTAGAIAHEDAAAVVDGTTVIRPGNTSADLGVAFTEDGEVVRLRSVVYYLREGSTPGAGTSLWRRVSGSTAAEELVEGVERLQFQYGEDTNGDATIGVGEYRNADEVEDWNQVLSVRIALLIRSLSAYGTDTDEREYEVLDETVEAPGDRHLRQVFSTTVAIRNLAS